MGDERSQVVNAEPVLPVAQATAIPAGGAAAAGAVPAANVVDIAAQVRDTAAGGDLLTGRFGPLEFDLRKRAFMQILTGGVGDIERYSASRMSNAYWKSRIISL